MNKIEVKYLQHKYWKVPLLTIFIDWEPLDNLLNKLSPGYDLSELISTLIKDWLTHENEFQVVWDRIYPKEKWSSIVPILMCPDDLDFSCNLIVVSIQIKDQIVIWEKIGEDITKGREMNPNLVGQEVKWFDMINKFQFDLKEYLDCINTFRFEDRNQ